MKFELSIEKADADTLANHLERIAGMVREGFTSGDASDEEGGRGWWNSEDLAEEQEDEDDDEGEES